MKERLIVGVEAGIYIALWAVFAIGPLAVLGYFLLTAGR